MQKDQITIIRDSAESLINHYDKQISNLQAKKNAVIDFKLMIIANINDLLEDQKEEREISELLIEEVNNANKS